MKNNRLIASETHLLFGSVGIESLYRFVVGVLLLTMFMAFPTSHICADADSRTPDGFALPQEGHSFSFPRDHGSHPEFKLEWWYITGHLWNSEKQRFGFQATFFRQAGPRSGTGSIHQSTAFEHSPLFLGHMAILDVASGKFIHQSRLNRNGWDAGADQERLRVWNGNWSLSGTNATTRPEWGAASQLHLGLTGSIRGEASVSLHMMPEKAMVIFGTNGVSRKADDPNASSYYMTFPQLKANGTLAWMGREFSVEGEAWMDHEISSGQLGEDQVGWDWICVQLRDGREFMSYRMRKSDGSMDRNSSLTWIDLLGKLHKVGTSEFDWKTNRTWRSPITGANYPCAIQISTRDPATGTPLVLQMEPLCDSQELADELGGVAYWEGACRVKDQGGKEIGQAFLELTGYAGNLGARLKATKR